MRSTSIPSRASSWSRRPSTLTAETIGGIHIGKTARKFGVTSRGICRVGGNRLCRGTNRQQHERATDTARIHRRDKEVAQLAALAERGDECRGSIGNRDRIHRDRRRRTGVEQLVPRDYPSERQHEGRGDTSRYRDAQCAHLARAKRGHAEAPTP